MFLKNRHDGLLSQYDICLVDMLPYSSQKVRRDVDADI